MTDHARSYDARAQEYAAFVDGLDLTADRVWIERAMRDVRGPVLDLGCGAGHWTAHLAGLGHDVEGVDPAAEIVRLARRRHTGVRFSVAGWEGLPDQPRYAAVLAWYSLIHVPPARVSTALARVRAALTPGGIVLLGFFDGKHGVHFDHAIAPAFTWSARRTAAELAQAGWRVQRVQQRRTPGARPHAAIVASRPD